MGAFLGALGRLLVGLVGPVVAKVLAKLGLGFVVYTGASAVLQTLTGYIQTTMGQLSSDMVGYLNLAGFSDVVSIITAAVTVRLTWKYGLDGGNIKRFGFLGN
jgi:hypothetical protein